MLRRTLLKLFTISPLALLASFKQIYLIHTVPLGGSDGSTVFTANPQNYRERLPDLWAAHRSLVQALADKCLATASSQDTRGWTLKKWNEELEETKLQWQIKRLNRA